MAQITTYFTSSSGGGISGSGAAGEVAFFTAATVLDSDSNLAWDDTNRRLSLNGPNTVGSTLVIAADGKTDATSALDIRTSLLNGDVNLFKIYDNGRIEADVLDSDGYPCEGIAIGSNAGTNIGLTGQFVFLGPYAGRNASAAEGAVAIGYNSLQTATQCSYSTAVGNRALYLATQSSANTSVGSSSLESLTTGGYNTAIGDGAARYRPNLVTPPGNLSVNPSYGVYVGAGVRSGATTANVQNEIVIGANVTGAGDNTTTIGNSSCVSCFISGNVVPELGMTIPDGTNITFDDGAGTKIGTNAAEKFAFWNATPNVQPTSAITSVTAVHGTGTSVKEDTKYNGYDLGQIVAALQRVGILA
jgi:hypothetical protein